jgi:predicted nucleic acid-binding protein
MTLPLPALAFVVDSSVVVKWYVEKEESDIAQAFRLLEHFGQGLCILRAPQLLPFEVANALVTSQRLPASSVHEALNHLRELSIELQPLSWATFTEAVEIAATCGTTIYDSYFLALALETGNPLVTADEVFLRKTRRYPGILPLRQLDLPD